MAQAGNIQVISKTDYTNQTVVPLSIPSATPLTTPNTVRIRSRILGLTTNLQKCAKMGFARFPGLDWWNIWPLPSDIVSEPFSDATKYCRIGAWGYAEVVESTIPSLAVGTWLYGYQPIGTVPEELNLEAVEGVTGGWVEVSERRRGLLGIYNFYIETDLKDEGRESMGWNALMQPFFLTSWLLNRFVFGWTGTGEEGKGTAIHPLGDSDQPWTKEDADLRGATVILLAASGKTGLAFAQQLRRGRPQSQRPSKIVAVGSEKSRTFTSGTRWFDEVLLYDDAAAPGLLDLDSKGKVLLVNFGARGNVADRWAAALRLLCKHLQILLVGTDPSFNGQSELLSLTSQPGGSQPGSSGVYQSNAGRQREAAIQMLGGAKKYTDEFGTAWDAFKAEGAVKGLNLEWGRGIKGFTEGWDALIRGEVGSDVGLVYDLT